MNKLALLTSADLTDSRFAVAVCAALGGGSRSVGEHSVLDHQQGC